MKIVPALGFVLISKSNLYLNLTFFSLRVMNYANNYIVFLKLSENDLNLVSQVLPVIVLQQNPDMIEQGEIYMY